MISLDVAHFIYLFIYLSCFFFSELPRSMVWYLTLIWRNYDINLGKVSVIIISNIFFLFLFLFFLLVIFPLHLCYTFYICHPDFVYSVLGVFFSLFFLFEVFFVFFFLRDPQGQIFFPYWCGGSLPKSPSKASLIFIIAFKISSISFGFFLGNCISLLTSPICSCMPSYIRDLKISLSLL